MISGSVAMTGSTLTRTSLSHINNLVTGATVQGLYRIFVENQYIDDTMVGNLRDVYGYKVTPKNSFMGTHNDYIISWEPAPITTPEGGSGTITFNGTDQYVTAINSEVINWLPGTGDFTIEWFMKKGDGGSAYPRVFSLGFDQTATIGCSIEGGTCYIWPYGGDLSGPMPQAYEDGTSWTHIAISRSGTTTKLFIDGSLESTKLNDDNDMTDVGPNSGFDLNIGVDDPESMSANWWAGSLTNFRWDNSAIYTGSTLNVPTEPLTETATTKLLLLGGSVENPVSDATGTNNLVNNGSVWNSDTPFV